jgi:exonuclease SbcC
MRFTHITLRDFMSYEQQELDLDGLDYVAIAGSNGSGKSSIALAIAWALFGTIRVKGDADSVVRDGQKDCGVTLEFDAEGTSWRIERSKTRTKSAKVRLSSRDADGQWVPYGDHLNATAQTRIEELVGMSEDAFYSLTIIDGQSGARFVKADSTQRRDILLNLLPEMGVWNQMEEQARQMLADDRSSVESEQTRLASEEETITETKGRVDEAQEAYEALDADSLRSNLTQIESDITTLANKVDSAAREQKEHLERAEREHEARKRELRAETKTLTSQADTATSTARTLRNLAADLDDGKRAVKDAHEEGKQARARATELDKKFESLKANEDDIETLETQARTEREQVSVLRSRIAADEKSLRGLTQMQEDHAAECPTCHTHLDDASLAALVARIEESAANARTGLERCEKAANKAEREAADKRKAIDDAGREADKAEDAVERLAESKTRAESGAERAESRLGEALQEGGFSDLDEAAAAATVAKKAADDAEQALKDYDDSAAGDLERLEKEYRQAKADAEEGKDGKRLAELRASKRDMSERIREADNLSGRIDTLRASIKETSESVRRRHESIKGTVQRIEALEQVVSACRPQGIPSMLLDGVLAPIEQEATRILNAVPGGEGMMLRFEQARALKSRAGAREVLDIIVTLPAGVERPIESLSAGETVRVSLALVFAMISVLGARRGGDALDTVFLDEPLGPLDQEAVPAFIEVLRSAVSAGSLSSVMVVTHDQRVIEALPQRIEVEREETGVSVASLIA